MKSKQTNLFEGGKDEWEKTNEYQDKLNKIIKDVTDKYAAILTHETSWIKKIRIKLKLEIEIRKKINELSSSKNLHAINSSTL